MKKSTQNGDEKEVTTSQIVLAAKPGNQAKGEVEQDQELAPAEAEPPPIHPNCACVLVVSETK